jgi:ribonuclease HII
VLGIDEAGRGPLAWAAADCLSNAGNVRLVEESWIGRGVVDSKLIGLESTRMSLYDQVIAIPADIVWAVGRRNLMGVGEYIV